MVQIGPAGLRWLPQLVVPVAFCAGVLVGALAYRAELHRPVVEALSPEAPLAPPAPGWNRVRTAVGGGALDELEAAQLTRLGYASGYEPGPEDTTPRVTAAAQPGFNLYTSGHAGEATLTDLEGRVLHRWAFEEARPASDGLGPMWRRARLEPNGDLFSILDYRTLYKLDARSNLLWRFDAYCHHDLDITEDGRVWVLTAGHRPHPAFPYREVVADNGIAVLSPDGTLERSVSILDAFHRSDYAALLQRAPEGPDVLHTNTLEVLDGRLASRSPAFRAGNVLISMRSIDTVAVVDLAQERVVWALAGIWRRQHEPTVLDSGRLLVFDNLGRGGRSRVLEIEPFTQRIAWRYPADDETPLFAEALGAAQRLANGNTLIVEATAGRALEVTRDGEVVWEFWNPERAGEQGEFIATLAHLERLPPDFPVDWADAAP